MRRQVVVIVIQNPEVGKSERKLIERIIPSKFSNFFQSSLLLLKIPIPEFRIPVHLLAHRLYTKNVEYYDKV